MAYWTLVVTQPNKEKLAVQNILNQGFECYLPLYREKIVKNGVAQDVARVLFARYIFCKVKQQWACLTGTYGVSALLMEGLSPKVVPQKIIDQIKQREDKQGFVVLDDDEELKKGKPVQITKGIFKDTIGIYQGMSTDERAIVLFKMLGSEREVKINPKLLVTL